MQDVRDLVEQPSPPLLYEEIWLDREGWMGPPPPPPPPAAGAEQKGKQGGKVRGSPPQVTVTTVLPGDPGEEERLVPRLPQSASY